MHAKLNPSVLEEMWPLIVETCEGDNFRETVLDGLMTIEILLRANGKSLLDKTWRDRVVKIGSQKLHKGAMDAVAYAGRGGGKVWAFGMCKVINTGLRNRLSISLDLD